MEAPEMVENLEFQNAKGGTLRDLLIREIFYYLFILLFGIKLLCQII